MKFAIFGANSTIALEYLSSVDQSEFESTEFHLFSRKKEYLKKILESPSSKKFSLAFYAYSEFSINETYDVIINFIGCGDPSKLKSIQDEMIVINDIYDNLILNYLTNHQQTLYIYLSSGAAYLNEFNEPISSNSKPLISFDDINLFDVYSLAKYMSEFKHRALQHLRIVDLRLFNYLRSKNIHHEKSLIGNIFECMYEKKTFITNEVDIIRDYIDLEDFRNAVSCIINAESVDRSYDLFSVSPVSKTQILSALSEKFGLNYEIKPEINLGEFNITGVKLQYFSNVHSLIDIGYRPSSSSIEKIIKAAADI